MHLLQDQIDRLYRACRLLGEDNTEIGHFLPGAGECLFAPVPDRNAGGNHDHEKQSKPDKRKMPAGARTMIEWTVGFLHP